MDLKTDDTHPPESTSTNHTPDVSTQQVATENSVSAPTGVVVAADQNQKPMGTKRRLLVGMLAGLMALAVGSAYAYTHTIKAASNIHTSSQSTQSTTAHSSAALSSVIDIPDAISPIDPTKIPLGDNRVSKAPQAGYVYSCQTSFSTANGGAQVVGPWVDTVHSTWNSATKVAVSGAVKWPAASYTVAISGSQRVVSANDLPINGQTTGVYPIASTDKAYQYDRNPNTISTQTVNLSLPVNPTSATTPGCMPGGMIGVLQDGVVLFDALDGEGRDAAAHETLDSCEGHPEKAGEYHHHNIPSCIMSKYKAPSSSTLVGYAADGYGIYIERDKNGNLLTNANLDACHGRTSSVLWDGKVVNMYHYDATTEFPYTVGCFHGTSTLNSQQSSGQPPAGTSGQGMPPQPGAGGPPPQR